MYFKSACPSCHKTLKVREERVGKRSRCPYCKSTVTIAAPQQQDQPAEQEDDSLSHLAAAARDPVPPAKRAGAPADGVPVARARAEGVTDATGSDKPMGAGSKVSGTDVDQLLSLASGVLFGLLFYGILFLFIRNSYLGELFIERGWVPFVLVLLTGWSCGILLLKWLNLRKQRSTMLFDVLPTDLAEEITVKNASTFARQIRALPGDSRQSFLLNRMLRGLEHFRVRRNTQEVANVLSSQSDIDATSVQSSYTIVKVFIWAIPILGFIGTVIGIGDSIGSFTGAMDNAQDVAKLKESLSGVTSGLATAFDTTLIALVMSLLVMFPTSSMQKAEEDLLNWVDEYCNENLLKRLKDAGDSEDAETARRIMQAVDAAMDKHHAGFAASAMMLERTAGRGAELAQKVAELQQAHLDRLGELSASMDRQDAALQAKLSENARAVARHLGQVDQAMASLNEVLVQLGGRQIVI